MLSGAMAGPGGKGAERREHERIPARIEIRFRETVDAARSLRAYSMNFSAGGLCIRTDRPYAVGAVLQLSMTVEKAQFELAGVVAWVRAGAVGVRFEGVSPADQARLSQVVRSLRQ